MGDGPQLIHMIPAPPSYNFRPMSIVAKRLNGSGWYGSLGPGDIVLDGGPAPLYGKGHSSSPLFGACLYCDQTVVGRPSQAQL